MLRSPRAKFPTAIRLRNDGVPIAEAFSFMSALYFRGKITYARFFASTADGSDGIFIITAGQGLVTPDWKLDREPDVGSECRAD